MKKEKTLDKLARHRIVDYGIGSDVWPGLSKVMEESAELIQVGAKIIGAGGAGIYFDNSNLEAKLVEEMGDTLATIGYFLIANPQYEEMVVARAAFKQARFMAWHLKAKEESS